MAENFLKKQLKDIEKKIKYHNDLYYNRDNPEISDSDYDKLINKYKKILKKTPNYKENISESIGGKPSETFTKYNHPTRMLSLDNAMSKKDLENFLKKISNFLNNKTDDF